MKIKIEQHCDEAMTNCMIIDFVTQVYKAAEGKKIALHCSVKYRDSYGPWIVLCVGPDYASTHARLEDDKGVLANFVYNQGFVPETRALAYQLI